MQYEEVLKPSAAIQNKQATNAQIVAALVGVVTDQLPLSSALRRV